MPTQLIACFFINQGRIARGAMVFRLFVVATLCIAFGTLGGELVGSYGSALFSAVFVWSAYAICAQRLHDIGKSAWALSAFVIPVLGPLWLLVQLCKRGMEGKNRFGSNPMSRSGYLTVDISQ